MTIDDVIRGLAIIRKYVAHEDPDLNDLDFRAEHDQVWAGDYHRTPLAARVLLEEDGWFEDCESWSHYT